MPYRKALLIANYGRSGQGWLGYMLCYVLNAAYVEPYDFLVGKNHTYSRHVLENTGGYLPNRESTDYSLVVKTHQPPSSTFTFTLTEKVLYLVRDPRDVALSMHNLHMIQERSVTWRHPRAKSKLALKKYFRFLDWLSIVRGSLRHYQCWKSTPHYLVKYEALLNNPAKELKAILNYLQAPVDENIVREAVELFSFEKITGRQRGEEDVQNPEFRKGVAGDYKNKFSPWQLRMVNFLFGDELKDLHYEVHP